jgi:hypothetical protein
MFWKGRKFPVGKAKLVKYEIFLMFAVPSTFTTMFSVSRIPLSRATKYAVGVL